MVLNLDINLLHFKKHVDLHTGMCIHSCLDLERTIFLKFPMEYRVASRTVGACVAESHSIAMLMWRRAVELRPTVRTEPSHDGPRALVGTPSRPLHRGGKRVGRALTPQGAPPLTTEHAAVTAGYVLRALAHRPGAAALWPQLRGRAARGRDAPRRARRAVRKRLLRGAGKYLKIPRNISKYLEISRNVSCSRPRWCTSSRRSAARGRAQSGGCAGVQRVEAAASAAASQILNLVSATPSISTQLCFAFRSATQSGAWVLWHFILSVCIFMLYFLSMHVHVCRVDPQSSGFVAPGTLVDAISEEMVRSVTFSRFFLWNFSR
eukprot:SAG31_NODE_187_length_20848_cov_22.521953_13_plen_321_part_00